MRFSEYKEVMENMNRYWPVIKISAFAIDFFKDSWSVTISVTGHCVRKDIVNPDLVSLVVDDIVEYKDFHEIIRVVDMFVKEHGIVPEPIDYNAEPKETKSVKR